MKKLFILSIFFIISCSPEDTFDQITLIGKWHDTYDYPTKEYINDSTVVNTTYPDIIYEFKDDLSFEVFNEKDWVSPTDGTWSINEDSTIVALIPKPSILDSIDNYSINFSWQIVNMTPSQLEVIHKVEGFADIDSFNIEFVRYFERVD